MTPDPTAPRADSQPVPSESDRELVRVIRRWLADWIGGEIGMRELDASLLHLVARHNRTELENALSAERSHHRATVDELAATCGRYAEQLRGMQIDNAELHNRLKIPHPARDFVNECNDALAAKSATIAALEAIMAEAERAAHLISELCRQLQNVSTPTPGIVAESRNWLKHWQKSQPQLNPSE